MCYAFVFDINNLESFDEVFKLASIINYVELNKLENNKNLTSIKIFIGNKFDEGIEDNNKSDKYYHSKDFFLEYESESIPNSNLRYILNKLKEFYKDEEEAKNSLYLTSAFKNFNISNTLSDMLRGINQKDSLWKILDFDDSNIHNKDSDDEELIIKPKKSFFDKLLCCFPGRGNNSNETSNKEKKSNVLRFEEEEYNSEDDNNDAKDFNDKIKLLKEEQKKNIIINDDEVKKKNNVFDGEEKESDSKNNCNIF